MHRGTTRSASRWGLRSSSQKPGTTIETPIKSPALKLPASRNLAKEFLMMRSDRENDGLDPQGSRYAGALTRKRFVRSFGRTSGRYSVAGPNGGTGRARRRRVGECAVPYRQPCVLGRCSVCNSLWVGSIPRAARGLPSWRSASIACAACAGRGSIFARNWNDPYACRYGFSASRSVC